MSVNGNRDDWCNRDYNFDIVIFTDSSSFTDVHEKRCSKYGHCQKMVPNFSPAVIVWGGYGKLGLSPLGLVNGNISSVKNCDINTGRIVKLESTTNGPPIFGPPTIGPRRFARDFSPATFRPILQWRQFVQILFYINLFKIFFLKI